MIALSNSIHLYARPDTKEKFLEFFTSILGLEAVESSEVIHVKLPAFSYPSPKQISSSVSLNCPGEGTACGRF